MSRRWDVFYEVDVFISPAETECVPEDAYELIPFPPLQRETKSRPEGCGEIGLSFSLIRRGSERTENYSSIIRRGFSSMCGIIGYVGFREAEPVLLQGLRRLEYRGYDSAGVATLTGANLHVRKKAGRVADLANHLNKHPAPGCIGIGHTRWATHGGATDHNAHPHLGGNGNVVIVHNGVIENYAALRSQLQAEGVVFHSDTDTEVIAHLIARQNEDDLVESVRRVLPMLKGTYGLAVLSLREPGLLVGARLGSPLVIGIADGE